MLCEWPCQCGFNGSRAPPSQRSLGLPSSNWASPGGGFSPSSCSGSLHSGLPRLTQTRRDQLQRRPQLPWAGRAAGFHVGHRRSLAGIRRLDLGVPHRRRSPTLKWPQVHRPLQSHPPWRDRPGAARSTDDLTARHTPHGMSRCLREPRPGAAPRRARPPPAGMTREKRMPECCAPLCRLGRQAYSRLRRSFGRLIACAFACCGGLYFRSWRSSPWRV